jgi:hypothetical protein
MCVFYLLMIRMIRKKCYIYVVPIFIQLSGVSESKNWIDIDNCAV